MASLAAVCDAPLVALICAFQAGWPKALVEYHRAIYAPSLSQLSVLDHAASTGATKVLAAAYKYPRVYCVSAAAMDAAASNGHYDTVQWLHHHGAPCSVWAMNGAAKRGHLQIVCFLHAHRSEGCTEYALHHALLSSHTTTAAFLLAHRAEGCCSYTLVRAAQLGCVSSMRSHHGRNVHRRLDLVEFLFCHGLQGRSGAQAMDIAATWGHLAIVQYLHAHSESNCTTQALDGAAMHGHADVVAFLVHHRREGYSGLGLERARHRGFDAIVATLLAHPHLLRY
ncbi:hypothetical protein SDRG_04808 [Saprolegnia diclina VS20]|uniref:Uncharacterized protein n=1 Tax=Saprolegnia diclina (strain VS20) TaxID=1156394 RepID=T0S4T1_SAPDV|nr:hypothetical protein SDRG_04808 [Saprolegnia diclina VS20]EQC37782.1 hypothetical protein SDRG_04808 [Saprolegnia diclina VS20]|eukprot:XP_008608715.1 hypothetical protein SDRG_04808 [Saprolegnia diclina VS20]